MAHHGFDLVVAEEIDQAGGDDHNGALPGARCRGVGAGVFDEDHFGRRNSDGERDPLDQIGEMPRRFHELAPQGEPARLGRDLEEEGHDGGRDADARTELDDDPRRDSRALIVQQRLRCPEAEDGARDEARGPDQDRCAGDQDDPHEEPPGRVLLHGCGVGMTPA